MPDRLFCIAPMMDYTDRHFRYLMRLLAPHARLFTEMVTSGAVLHGGSSLLEFHPSEHPLVLQLGGSDPEELAYAAVIAEARGYDEINLNVGCPSGKVQRGQFGACLMRQPAQVAECVAAMQAKVSVPVTVKCRIGVDDQDVEESLFDFVQTVSAADCRIFYVHARKALLSRGLSPRQNRTIPPLDYVRVYRLKQQFPSCEIILNGGIQDVLEVREHLGHVDGVMVGRLAYENPAQIRRIERHLFPEGRVLPMPLAVLDAYFSYLLEQCRQGVPLARMTRHLSGLFHSTSGAKAWRKATNDPPPNDKGINYLKSLSKEIAT